ncbi:uncharacterized protein LOC111288571 isoform X2 [Durio zibethinus]|uniref:Uncharacterized protein LOC111288571 isoform X2 n=1 Tax=Durio zibethinus TaxID=66656 RepID=A0A6P5Y469_DURZI|nr:uncharacterized protein LOC111288571 isoform X2 [Durio zibethinus]
MEPAKIDWKRINSRFVEDCVYEHINAPKWFDFLALEDSNSIDDQAWFCRPDCNHPMTAEEFLQTTPPSKLARSANGSGSGSLSLGERNQGDYKLKQRGQVQSLVSSKIDPTFDEDSENLNPNLSTPLNHQAKSLKAAIKSSSGKKKPIVDISQSTNFSARKLFSGRDILNHITEFCNELKKLATRAKEREDEEKLSDKKSQEAVVVKKVSGQVLGDLDMTEKERKPLLEMGKEKLEGMEKGSAKDKERRKKSRSNDETENIPVSLNLEYVKHKGQERVLQIRTNPPSPQCFSAPHAPMKNSPSKASRSRLMERGILQELKQTKDINKDEPPAEKPGNISSSTNIIDGRQARALDVFWFLKPCTLSE